MFSPCVRWLNWLLVCRALLRMKACSYSLKPEAGLFIQARVADYVAVPRVPFAFLTRAFREIRSATSGREAICWTLMDSDTDDESS